MPLLKLEHSPFEYRADFIVYGLLCMLLAGLLVVDAPVGEGWRLMAWVLAGAAGWTLLEYLLHRFVLHALPPFKGWHAEHHRRPNALVALPTLMTVTLFATLIGLPAAWLLGTWPATALSLGLAGGYLSYGLIHHATHHGFGRWPSRQSWLAQRRRWHAMHHRRPPGSPHAAGSSAFYGVSNGFWDRVFGTGRR
ncbi:sterol desaturase family protein [Roseateles sp.]|uniref:sterol desaturase family protein n=1 Tax=Roseateles sp. TaxID=1971397 RepID=UPI003264EDCC